MLQDQDHRMSASRPRDRGLEDYSPVWARERCRISPPRFLAECCKRQLNQGSFVLLYFRLSTFSDLYWVCVSVFSCTVLFVSISQVIGLRSDLYCVEWGVKLYSNQPTNSRTTRLVKSRNYGTVRGGKRNALTGPACVWRYANVCCGIVLHGCRHRHRPIWRQSHYLALSSSSNGGY